MAIQAPDGGDPGEFLIRFPGAGEHSLEPLRVGSEPADRDMDVRCPERFFPVFGGALTDIPQYLRASGHALLEGQGEAVERVRRYPQRLEALERDCDADPSLLAAFRRGGGAGERR